MIATTFVRDWSPIPAGEVRWVRSFPSEEAPHFRLGRSEPDVLVAEWPGLVRFRYSRGGKGSRRLEIFEGLEDPRRAEKFYYGQIQALVRHLEGRLTLHASAAVLDGCCIGFLGYGGSGKSSMAGALAARHEAAFVADDTLAWELDGSVVRAHSLDLHNWLCPDMLAEIAMLTPTTRWKTPVDPRRRATEPVPLFALVSLVFDDRVGAPDLRRLEGRACFELLSDSTARFILDEDAIVLRDFELLSALASRVPVYELRRSRTPGSLEASIAAVKRLLLPNA